MALSTVMKSSDDLWSKDFVQESSISIDIGSKGVNWMGELEIKSITVEVAIGITSTLSHYSHAKDKSVG